MMKGFGNNRGLTEISLNFLDPSYTSRIVHRVALGFLLWKMLSDLRIIFFIRELVLNVLMASAMDAMWCILHCLTFL